MRGRGREGEEETERQRRRGRDGEAETERKRGRGRKIAEDCLGQVGV